MMRNPEMLAALQPERDGDPARCSHNMSVLLIFIIPAHHHAHVPRGEARGHLRAAAHLAGARERDRRSASSSAASCSSLLMVALSGVFGVLLLAVRQPRGPDDARRATSGSLLMAIVVPRHRHARSRRSPTTSWSPTSARSSRCSSSTPSAGSARRSQGRWGRARSSTCRSPSTSRSSRRASSTRKTWCTSRTMLVVSPLPHAALGRVGALEVASCVARPPLFGLLGLLFLGFGFVATSFLDPSPSTDWLRPAEPRRRRGRSLLALLGVRLRELPQRSLGQRSTRYGAGDLLYTLLFVALVAGVELPRATRHHQRWDVTEAGVYTLSPQSTKVVASAHGGPRR